MENIRVSAINVIDTSTIEATFTHVLRSDIGISNISIVPKTPNIPTPTVLSVKLNNNILKIRTTPLTYLGAYFIIFKSTDLISFTSLNGDAILLEDDVNNKKFLLGPQEATNPVRQYLDSYYNKNIFNIEDGNTVVSKYLDGISSIFSRALYDIGQFRNDNYISKIITDERVIRSDGPYDRLGEEGVYEVLRVARTKTGTNASKTFSYDVFPTSVISLGKTPYSQNLTIDSEDIVGKFNINSLVLNVNYSPVIKLNYVKFIYSSYTSYDYDISKYGYQLKSSKYDSDYAFSLDTLEKNQIKLNDKILEDVDFSLEDIIRVEVSYEYNDLGIVVDSTSISAYTTLNSNREVIPPIVNVFDLKYAPIVDDNGNISQTNGVLFIDPNSSGNSPHPAFASEIPFRLDALPYLPGQYSVDYSIGRVYVYGQSATNPGTGAYPPLATYKYKYTYVSDVDYTYDDQATDIQSSNDFVALPNGSLAENAGTISFKYEKVLVPDVDYKSQNHTEVLSERIENRLVAPTVIKTKNSPITDVFRVYNETSGEIYNIIRWNDDKIHVSYNTPPSIKDVSRERVNFKSSTNELLFVNTSFDNILSTKIFKILLKNNKIIASSEDCIGSFVNTSVKFSDLDIFKREFWYDQNVVEANNYNKLYVPGDYCIDYVNGVVYLAVSTNQDYNIGTITYKYSVISPSFTHLISVNDIYYNIDLLGIKNKNFEYVSFDEGMINITSLDTSDEYKLNSGDVYQIFGGQIGAFTPSFTPGVNDPVKSIRGLYEHVDLTNNVTPLNFATASSFSDNVINVGSLINTYYSSIKTDGYSLYVDFPQSINYLSSNINYDISIVRLSDGYQLWDNSGIISTGTNTTLILSGYNTPSFNDLVKVVATFTINDLSSVVVDYNKGDLYVDYTYLADEIVISYEHGDNLLDFRQSTSITPGEEYFVSYKVGALRDGLLNNFGTLINIPELLTFDIGLERERYRDIVYAALSSFVKGPTVEAIKNIGNVISHIEPEVIESIFSGWTLGESYLNPKSVQTDGEFELLPAKYGSGALINDKSQKITLPQVSNLRLEEGTFETWVSPSWNGLDNDANLTFKISQDGYIIDNKKIFIGQAEVHPELNDNEFSISKLDNVQGTPNLNKDGIFIYYDKDPSGLFNRWYVNVVDGYTDGYDAYPANFSITINSNGSFYDIKSIDGYTHSNQQLFSGTKSITYNINSGYLINQGITFISDIEHYILDVGEDKDRNRLSIYKDVSGYLVFRVFDKFKTSYIISADVSSWMIGENHHVAASWKIGNATKRDELHLFVDGFEVPNIVRYGQKLSPYPHEKFRTVIPEEIIGLAGKDIVGGTDLQTISGSSIVSSLTNFGAYNISPGDTLFVNEVGFDENGYTILLVSGQSLTLSAAMPYSVDEANFSVNKTDFTVNSEIDLYNNYYISKLEVKFTDNDLSISSGSNIITSSGNDFNTIGVLPGYIVRVNYTGLETAYTVLSVNASQLVLDALLPSTASGVEYFIYSNEEVELNGERALRPDYSHYKDINFNNVLSISNNVKSNELLLLRTLGLSFRKVKAKHYVWGNDFENVIQTKLPPPVSLDDVGLYKIILDTTPINQSTATYSLGLFNYTNNDVYQPINSYDGRTLTVEISGNNTDFSTPATVIVSGVKSNFGPGTETIIFSDYGKLDTANRFISISSVSLVCKPINSSKTALTISIKEKYTALKTENSNFVARLNFSYKTKTGTDLYFDGYGLVRDDNKQFSHYDMNGYLVITSPVSAAGYYKIIGFSEDLHSMQIEGTPASNLPIASFYNGEYFILNTSEYRSGFQNGFFILEQDVLKGQGYPLIKGLYEFDYYTYLNINFDPVNANIHLGSDIFDKGHLNGIIDHTLISDIALTDKRPGETTLVGEINITKNFNSIKAPKLNAHHLVYMTYDTFPFINYADLYKKYSNSKIIDKPSTINDDFGNSMVITKKSLRISNDGILDTKKEGTIEFWVNPMFDTYNDPGERYYFDAFGAITEEVVSLDNLSVQVSGNVGQVIKVELASSINNIDYFSGGSVEVDLQSAVQEEVLSSGTNIVNISNLAVQILSVKLVGDLTNQDYFQNGTLSSNQKTIYLGKSLPSASLPVIVIYKPVLNTNNLKNKQIIRLNKQLPSHKSKVIVHYLPKGIQGDRISIFKDNNGMLNFRVMASYTDFTLKGPMVFSSNTWHRIKASYKFNSGKSTDEMRLWIDGYEIGNVRAGNFVPGPNSAAAGVIVGNGGIKGSINFKDPINEFTIGSQYDNTAPAFCSMDNVRISNIFRPLYAPYGENLDVNYSKNLSVVFPATEDLYTTYLSDNNTTIEKINDFTNLLSKNNGNFDFYVNIFDSFGIVDSSAKVKEILEKLINLLKPASSRAFLSYIK